MKFSKQWLQEWLAAEVDTEDLLKQLPMLGHEIDSSKKVAGDFTGVIVAEIVECIQHPNADRLQLCKVNNGTEILPIVCGGKNARAGIKVALAIVGAQLPGNLTIKHGKIRGEESLGMLCSEVELGLAETSEGIIELPADAPVGKDLRDYLQLNDWMIEVDLTPNRGDCLSIQGIAREVAAKNSIPIRSIAITEQAATISDVFPIKVSAKTACPNYVGRVIKQINPAATTPLWLKEKLRRSGIRSISPVVDVTNYILLELGQPLHAFDLAKLDKEIQVRFAETGESILLLNEETIKLKNNTLVIADASGPIAMAGIMGGFNSRCTETTTDIFLESALFVPEIAAGKARQYGMHSDSSHRFERGVEPNLQKRAIERATELLLNIVGGKAGPVISVTDETQLPKKSSIQLSVAKVQRILGMDIPKTFITNLLNDLQMQVTELPEGWNVLPPSFRYDVNMDLDLIEEIARFYGYNNIPLHHPKSPVGFLAVKETERKPGHWRQCLMNRGYHEAMTYSFVDPKIQQLLEPNLEPLALANPISVELGVMRTSLWAGLLQAVLYNQNRQQQRVRLFETGKRFIQQADGLQQEEMIAGVITDTDVPTQWSQTTRNLDFFDLKGDVEALLELTGNNDAFIFSKAEHSALHPGQSSRLIYNEKEIGWLGALHPQVQQRLGLDGSIFLFEIQQDALARANLPAFTSLSKFPLITRDLALLMKEAITAAEVSRVVKSTASKLLVDFNIFDVYRGKGVPDGYKSVAVTLTLQDKQRTLLDEEVNELMNRVIKALDQQLHATLREV